MNTRTTRPQPSLQSRLCRLGWWWALVFWCFFGGLLAFGLQQEHQHIEQDERARLSQQAAVIAENLSQELAAIDDALSSLSHDFYNHLHADHAILSVRLKAFKDAMPGVRTLSALDAHGISMASNRADIIGMSFNQREYFLQAQQASDADTLIVSQPFQSVLGDWVIVLARIIPDANGHFNGLITATLDPERFSTLLKSVHYAPDMLTGLTHGNGMRFLVIAQHFSPAHANLAQHGTIFTQHRALGTPSNVLRGYVLPGEPQRLMAMHNLQPHNFQMSDRFVVGVGREWQAIFTDWHTKAWQLALFYLFSTIAVILGILYMQRRTKFVQDARTLSQKESQLEERWRSIMEATHQGIWDWQRNSKTPYLSSAWLEQLGYSKTDCPNWRSLVHPEDLPRVAEQIQQHLTEHTPVFNSTHRMRHKDLHYQWFQCRGRVTERSDSGRPLRFIGTFADATQQHLQQLQLDLLAENVPGMLYQYQQEPDGHSFFPYVSKGSADLYGYHADELTQNASAILERIHPDDRQRVEDSIKTSANTLSVWQDEYRVILPTRGERWINSYAKPQRLQSGATLWHGYNHDISTSKQLAIQLKETEQVLTHLMNEMPIGLCMVDEQQHFYFRNRLFQEYFGFDCHTPLTLDVWWLHIYPDPYYRTKVQRAWNKALNKARKGDGIIPSAEFKVFSTTGRERTIAIGGIAFGQQFLATFEDRTEQRAQHEALRNLAFLDALTGVANRRHFDQSLTAEWRRAQRNQHPLTVIMIDLDYFKQYNDIYGHQQGDRCLQQVASTIRSQLNRSHDLLARYGGEEFVCLLPECDAAGAANKARDICRAVSALAIPHGGSKITDVITISLGLATQVPTSAEGAEQLLASADQNLYNAKTLGRNRAYNGCDPLCG